MKVIITCNPPLSITSFCNFISVPLPDILVDTITDLGAKSSPTILTKYIPLIPF